MADDLTLASGATLRAPDIGGKNHPVSLVGELLDVPVSPSGGAVVYTVDDSPAVPLNTPTAPARYARLRVYHATQDSTKRLYYRSDGTSPTADGANAFGFLLHGDSIVVKLADLTSFVMIGETGSGNFSVYAEFFNLE